jgi:D-lactate dehydrogenase (cytochrome)
MVKEIARQHHSGDFIFTIDEEERNLLWSARKEALWSMLCLVTDNSTSVYSTDIAVPLSRLADIIGNINSNSHDQTNTKCRSFEAGAR